MKAEELRIRNYVINDCDDSVMQVTAQDILTFSIDEDWLLPIPLTEQWLLNFGFGKTSGYPYKMLNGYIRIRNGIYFFKFYTLEVELPYVHTLQNLYYSLTNKEL